MSLATILRQPMTAAGPAVSTANAGRVISCWGAVGGGKTTLSVNLAFELASLGKSVLLVDADSHRPAIASTLGLVDAGPGITAILRLARSERLDLTELERLSEEISFNSTSLRVVTGINAPSRWPELDSPGLSEFLRFAREHFDFTVLDVATELEAGLYSQSSDTSRNFASSEILSKSDQVLGVFTADPVGVNRFLWDLREASFEFWPIANRVRSSVLGRNPERQLRDTMFRIAQLQLQALIPEDSAALDASQQRAQPLLLAAKTAKARESIRRIALELLDDLPN